MIQFSINGIMDSYSLTSNEMITPLLLKWIIQVKKGIFEWIRSKFAWLVLKGCKLVCCGLEKTLFYLLFGVGWNFPTPSYTTTCTNYLFDNQMKTIVGVGCRQYWCKLDSTLLCRMLIPIFISFAFRLYPIVELRIS